jgi:glycerol-3-phosphate dehydrogenase
MAYTLSDILMRRTGIGTLGNPGDDSLALAAKIAAEELDWSDKRTSQELKEVRELIIPPK